MNQEEAKKIFKEEGIVHIPQFKKIWYSITKFEKYPEMATEGVGRAFLYLLVLILMFSIIFVFALLIKFNFLSKGAISFIETNFEQINYQNGELTVNTKNENITTDIANFVINTKKLTDEQTKAYENRSSFAKVEVILLRDKAILKNEDNVLNINYKDILEKLEIYQFDKSDVVSLLQNEINSPKAYVVYGIIMTIYLFIAYFIAALFDVLILSFFGWITTIFAKIQIRYRAIFNMAVYAITLSTVLRLVYFVIRLFTNFEIKYFDLMYTAISFICLAAAIFMIKSDVIKQQLELMKVIEIKKQQKLQDEENTEEKEEKEEKEKKETDKEENNGKDNNKKQDDMKPDIEGQVN